MSTQANAESFNKFLMDLLLWTGLMFASNRVVEKGLTLCQL